MIARLREPLEKVTGVQTTLFSAQDLRGGGRQGGAQFQYAMITQDINELRRWALVLQDKLRSTPGIVDVTSDQDRAGPQVNVVIDRDAAARLGVNTAAIDNALNNAYSQRQYRRYTRHETRARWCWKLIRNCRPTVAARPHLCRREQWHAGAVVSGGALRARYGATDLRRQGISPQQR